MNRDEKAMYELMEGLTEEESIRLLESLHSNDTFLSESDRCRIKSNVITGINNASRKDIKHVRRILTAASVGVIIMLLGLTPFGKKAIADITSRLYFIPGIGSVVESTEQSFYILPEEITHSYKGSTIVIKSISKDSKSLIIRLEGSGYGAHIKPVIVDDKGNIYDINHGMSGIGKGWFGIYTFYNPPEHLNNFSILLSDEIKIPVNLKSATSFSDYSSLGPSDIKNGLGITLVPSKLENKVRIDLIEHAKKGRLISCYGYDWVPNGGVDIVIKDQREKVYALEEAKHYYGTKSEFYFPLDSDAENFNVQIPHVTVKYNIEKKLILPVPKTGEVVINKTVKVNSYDFNISKVVRQGETYKVYVNMDYSKDSAENPLLLHLDSYRSNGRGNEQLIGYGWTFDENLVVNCYEFQVRPEDKEMIIQLKELYTSLKGPWNFDFSLSSDK
jgi:hypothetical protein